MECPVCSKDFKTKGALGSHMRTHGEGVLKYEPDGWGYFRCDFNGCDMKTKSRKSFSAHISRHKDRGDARSTREEKAVGFCPKCKKTFLSAGARANHMRYCMGKKAVPTPKSTTGILMSLLDRIAGEASEEKRLGVITELKQALGFTTNTGCIDRMFCPKCRDSNSFKIAGQVVLTVDAVGAHMDKDEAKKFRWDDFSVCVCSKCGWTGQVGEFSPKDAPREASVIVSVS